MLAIAFGINHPYGKDSAHRHGRPHEQHGEPAVFGKFTGWAWDNLPGLRRFFVLQRLIRNLFVEIHHASRQFAVLGVSIQKGFDLAEFRRLFPGR
jgi:hypothetical protein